VDEASVEDPQTFPPVSAELIVTQPDAPTIPMQGWIDVAPHLHPTAPVTWEQPRRAFISRRVSLPVWAMLLVIPCLLAALGFGLVLGTHWSANLSGAQGRSGAGLSGAPSQHVTGGQIPQWTMLQTFAGNGSSNTTPFTITGSVWNVVWTCDPQSEGESYQLTAQAARPGSTDGPTIVDMRCDPSDPTTWKGQTAEYAAGTFYLTINSDGPWTFAVEVPR
jgi:hypothetical protein